MQAEEKGGNAQQSKLMHTLPKKEKRKHTDSPISPPTNDIRKYFENPDQSPPKKHKPDTIVRLQLLPQTLSFIKSSASPKPGKDSQAKITTEISSKVPNVFAPFKESIEDFAEQVVEHFTQLQLPRKKVLSIVKHVAMRHITPVILKLSEGPKEETEFEISECDEDVVEMQSLVQKYLKARPDFHTKCAFSHTSEVPWTDSVRAIKKWLVGYKRSRLPGVGSKKKAVQALVLFGTNEIDKRRICDLICKEMDIKMVVFDASMTITEQVFQKMETGKSYSISARRIDDSKEEYQLTAGESLVFIDNIDLLARYSSMNTATFYRHLFEIIKNAKSPIIISCEHVPLTLKKRADLLEFMHVGHPLNELEILSIHANLVYRFEMSGCVARLLEKVEQKAKLQEVADKWKSFLQTLIGQKFVNEDVWKVVKESQGNTDLLFTKLYELLHLTTGSKEEPPLDKREEEEAIESVAEKIEYESCVGLVENGGSENLVEKISARNEKVSKAFFFGLPLLQISPSEYPDALDVLRVIIERAQEMKKTHRRKAAKLHSTITVKDLGLAQPLEMPMGQFVAFVKQMSISNGVPLEEFELFIKSNQTLYEAHGIPQEKVLEGETDTYKITDYFCNEEEGMSD